MAGQITVKYRNAHYVNISDDRAGASDVHIRKFTNTPFCTAEIGAQSRL
jgi:hypothetical protein